MGFDAGKAVEPLEYNLAPYGGSGVIPEPSDDDILKVQEAFQSLSGDLGVDTGGQVTSEVMEQVADRLGDNTAERVKEINHKLLSAISEFCKGTPSVQELERLPIRVRDAFIGWLMGQFSPESRTVDTKP